MKTCLSFTCNNPPVQNSWYCEKCEQLLVDNAKLEREMSKVSPPGKCVRCGKGMVLRRGPKGLFYGCTRYPKCYYIKPIPKQVDS